MKNLFFLTILLFLSSCAEDITPDYDVEKKVYKSNHAKEINQLTAQIPHSSKHLFRSKTIPNSDGNATIDLIRLIDKTPISDWKKLDIQVKKTINELEKSNENQKYDIAIQYAVYRFLVHKLYEVDESRSISNEIKFYLDLLISKEAVEYDVLTFGILKLEHGSNYDTRSFRKYTIEGAETALEKYLALKEKKLKEEPDEQFFHQNTLSHYQRIIDDAKYALAHLQPNN